MILSSFHDYMHLVCTAHYSGTLPYKLTGKFLVDQEYLSFILLYPTKYTSVALRYFFVFLFFSFHFWQISIKATSTLFSFEFVNKTKDKRSRFQAAKPYNQFKKNSKLN